MRRVVGWRMSRRGACGLLAAAVWLVVAVGAPAARAATSTVTFESPGVADGTVVSTQFASLGPTFTQSSPDGTSVTLPQMSVTSLARSGTHALNISTNSQEFPTPEVAGSFSQQHSTLTAWVRNVTDPGSSSYPVGVRLDAYDATGHLVAQSGGGAFTQLPSNATAYMALTATSAATNIAGFRIRSDPLSIAGRDVLLDDLTFDVPTTSNPNFSLIGSGAVVLPQGGQRSTGITINRIDGSTGAIALAYTGLPPGVTASIAPNPVTGTGTSATLRLSAYGWAPTTSTYVNVTVTGTTSDPAAGPPDTHPLTIPVLVVAPFAIGTSHALSFALPPCSMTDIPVDLARLAGGSEEVDFSLADVLPADVTASFSPASTTGSGAATTVLHLARGDAAMADTLSLHVIADSPGMPDVMLTLTVGRPGPTVTGIRGAPLVAPQALAPGRTATVLGTGFCSGAQVRFGNDRALAPLTGVGPDQAGGLHGAAVTPRLATDGQVTVVNPSGASGPGQPFEVQTYRDTFGFPFPNRPWTGGTLRDWQELLGPAQTNLTIPLCLIDCTVVTPFEDPIFGIFHALSIPILQGSGGNCVGDSIGSRRIAAGQVYVTPTPASVWSMTLDGPERIRGRGDIPLRDTWYMPVGDYLEIQHQAQLTAEFVRNYFGGLTGAAIGAITPGLMRADLESQLRAGRRPVMLMLNIQTSSFLGSDWATGWQGHAVVAYDIEDRSGGGFYIRVWDNNHPFTPGERTDAGSHQQWEEGSRIEVRPDGTWAFPNLGWSGNPGSLTWITAETQLPVQPTSLISLEGLATLIFGSGAPAGQAGPAAAARTVDAIPLVLGDQQNQKPIVVARTSHLERFRVTPGSGGHVLVGTFGSGLASEVDASGARAGELIVPSGNSGIGFAGGPAAQTKLTLASVAGADRRIVEIDGLRGGSVAISFDQARRNVMIQTSGGHAADLHLQLVAYGPKESLSRFDGTVRIGGRGRVQLRPRWNSLSGALSIALNGRSRRLANHVRQAVSVKNVKLRVRRAGTKIGTTVRARVRGAPEVITVGVEVLQGMRVVARTSRMLTRAGASALLRGITLSIGLKSRSQQRVRVTVNALGGRPLPTEASATATAKVR